MTVSKRNRKAKATLRAEAYSWLAQYCTDTQWNRILDLREISLEAVLDYIKTSTDSQTFEQFEAVNLPPEVLAERRKKAAEAKQREEDARRTIRNYAPTINFEEQLTIGGPRWHDAALTSA